VLIACSENRVGQDLVYYLAVNDYIFF